MNRKHIAYSYLTHFKPLQKEVKGVPFTVNEINHVEIRMDQVVSGDLLAVTLDNGICYFLEKRGDYHLGFCEVFMPWEVRERANQIAEKYSGAVTSDAMATYGLRTDKSQRISDFLAAEMLKEILVSVLENQQTPVIDIGRTILVYFANPGFIMREGSGWKETWTAPARIVSIKPASYRDAETHRDLIGTRA